MVILSTANAYFSTISRTSVLAAHHDEQKTDDINSKNINFSKEWALKKAIHTYPEIAWFAEKEATETQEENSSENPESWSKMLFEGKQYAEFDRTLMSLKCLNLILNGSHEAYAILTRDQKENEKLSWLSFHILEKKYFNLIANISLHLSITKKQAIELFETALVLRNIGKTKKARDFFLQYNLTCPDHNDFYVEVIKILKNKKLNIFTSFNEFNEAIKDFLTHASYLAHYGHITHLEGDANMFLTLIAKRETNVNFSLLLQFDFFVHLCNVAGAQGHVNPNSSLVLNEKSYQALMATYDACKLLEKKGKTKEDAFEKYISYRAKMLGLNPKQAEDRALTNIGCMLRLFSKEDGFMLKKAFLNLLPEDQRKIILMLIKKDYSNYPSPTNVVSMLINLFNNSVLQGPFEERLSEVIKMCFLFFDKVIKKYENLIKTQSSVAKIPLNFNEIARVAKSSLPYDIVFKDFVIQKDGLVMLV